MNKTQVGLSVEIALYIFYTLIFFENLRYTLTHTFCNISGSP